ncbi:transposase [Nitrospira tepida]|uniref:Mutator family transposase n=1 Tax=Nitrospira tepida TaxID=2973512 RepID=A0AA86N3X1_9BACT|nr:transposase [Nitrospira tepida]CAI4034181.1 transposase [Nitrospira tepida]
MRNVIRITTEGKVRPIRRRAVDAIPAVDERASLVALIQALIPLGLHAVGDALEAEVTDLAGERYSRTGGQPGYVRWCQQRGSVYLLDQKLPITYRRVRNRFRNVEVALPTYQALGDPRAADAGLFRKVLHGLSCRRYEACAEAVPEAFGLSASSVSRRFMRASARQLRKLSERRLEQDEVVVLVLDGKTFADDSMVLALGVTRQGEKKILGFVQTATENEPVCAAFLRDLVTRGLRTDQGLLCVIDGAKGLRKAIQTVFGRQAVVQRCQWHKRENVVRYLPKGHQAPWRRRVQQAYERPTYTDARAALLRLRQELRTINLSAVASLDEGLEETLTLHRLGLFGTLGRSLKTTNCLESLNAQLGQLTDKVDRWRTSDQKHRWVASAVLAIEPRLRRIKGYRHLTQLQEALQRDIQREAVTETRIA